MYPFSLVRSNIAQDRAVHGYAPDGAMCSQKPGATPRSMCGTLLMQSRAITPIGTAGNSVPDLSCAPLAILVLECLTQKAN